MKANVWTLCLAILFVAFTPRATFGADDLDTLLAQPPSASLSAEDAAHRIEMLRSLSASHPDRADEIEAYLIPFVRVTQPPAPAAPTPTPVPPAATAKPLLLIREPGGSATVMRATSYQRQGAVIMVVAANGSRAIFQTPTVLGELPWYSEQELASGAVDLNALAGRYESVAKAMPALRAVLGIESTRLRKMQAARDGAASTKEGDASARLAEATTAVYEPASNYTRAALARLLLAAEKARNEMPEAAAKIDAWAAPFREHFEKLLAGHSFVKGAWVSNAELARQDREKRQAVFLSGLDYQIGKAPFPAGAVRGMVTLPLIGAVLALAAGVALVILGRKRTYLLGIGAGLLAVTPLAMAAAFFLATRDPALLPPSLPVASEQPIVEVLSRAAGLDESPVSQQISEAELNAFLARHVRLAADSGDLGPADARKALTIRFLPGRLAIFEMIHSLGLNWIVRMDVEFRRVDGKPALALVGAKIGALDCPKKLATALWENLAPQFAAILSSSRLDTQFAIQNPRDGAIELKSLVTDAAATP